jgi:hypothetical protein
VNFKEKEKLFLLGVLLPIGTELEVETVAAFGIDWKTPLLTEPDC